MRDWGRDWRGRGREGEIRGGDEGREGLEKGKEEDRKGGR